MTLTVTSLVLVALALAILAYAPRARNLAGAATLFAVSLALPVHSPTLLAGATLVAADTAGAAEAVALLAAAIAGLVAIARPAAPSPLSCVIAFALVGSMVLRALKTRVRTTSVLDLAARGAIAVAVFGECLPSHRLAPLVRVASLTLAAARAFTTLAATSHARATSTARRHRAAVARHARRVSPTSAPPPPTFDDLATALRRIVHELRQPIGAASNALATGTLASTDHATATALRDLASSELQGALASLEFLARFARVTAGEPVELPGVDAVEIALGRHAGAVAIDRSFAGSLAVDPAPLAHALDALVQNAFDAAPESPPLVSLRESAEEGFIVICVSDEGLDPVGAALDDAARPFFTTRAGRLGLGASIAARYAASMGGRFALRRDGGRTLAELHLPRKRPS